MITSEPPLFHHGNRTASRRDPLLENIFNVLVATPEMLKDATEMVGGETLSYFC